MSNILRVKFGTSQTVNADSLWQYDYGQILKMEGLDLPNAYEVHFAKYGDETSVTMIGNADGVVIPDILLQTPGEIRAWLYLHTGLTDGETVYQVNIQVQLRAAPTNEEPTPVQQDTITQTLAALAQAQMDADEIVQTAESWAVGERGGVPVLPQDETYHNNAKYYADEANTASNSAAESASAADTSASNAATSASAASTSATSAASAKTAAETASGQASTYASNAAASASAASASASNASGSAASAASSASSAAAAKDEAVGAKDDAETFASNAETAAAEAASSASSAASSTADAAGSAASAGASASAAAASASTASTKASAAAASADAAEAYMLHYPIVQNDYWYVWDAESEEYVSTGVKALGEDGYDPTVAITTPASGVHRVTITDNSGDHVFDVLDGATGPQGERGPQGPQGDDYVLTAADKAEIAQIVLDEALPSAYAKILAGLEIYIADYYSDPPTITYGVIDRLNRTITVEIIIVG